MRIAKQIAEALEAAQLLAAGLTSGQETQITALAARLGRWPVRVKLANGILRERVGAAEKLEQAVAYVNADLEENGLTAFDEEDAKQRDRAVAATLGVSLKVGSLKGDGCRPGLLNNS